MLSNGLSYHIQWETFTPGASIFVPAIDAKAAIEAMKKESERLEFEFVHKIVVEDGVKGVRFWRL